MNFEYAFLTLARAPTPHQALAAHLRGVDGVIGQFAPQLGWANNEAAVLLHADVEPGALIVPEDRKSVG